MAELSDLRQLQEALYRLIVAPDGVAAGVVRETALGRDSLESLIGGDGRMTVTERLGVYADGYFYRLLAVLKEDYPATLTVLGPGNFHNLITGYLIDYPPTEPSIDRAGRCLPDFLQAHPLRGRWSFAADLARLELAVLESFLAAEAIPLGAEAMRAVPPTEWPGLAMLAHPATRLVDCAWRVDELLRAVEAGAGWAAPAAAAHPIAVWRSGGRVHYRITERGEGEALRLALAAPPAGVTFAAICETIAAAVPPPEDAAASINRMLARWLADGLLTGVQ